MPVQLRAKKYREPDVLFFSTTRRPTDGSCVAPPDLVMEVVSLDDPDRDYVTKRVEYAQAGIPEYWIIDPLQQRITVLVLAGGEYVEFGAYGPGMDAASKLLDGFRVDANEVFAAAS
jgi:Uma2 family endonuclease